MIFPIVTIDFFYHFLGNETLRDRYKQDAKLAFVIKSIWTMAYGLHNMQKKLCPHSTNSCPAMLPVNGSIFLHHLLNVSFFWHNETVSFNEMGDPPGRYDLMNFQRLSDGTYDYNHVGSWDSHSNQLLIMKPFQWPSKTLSADESTPKSVCSKPCEKGYAKVMRDHFIKYSFGISKNDKTFFSLSLLTISVLFS